MSKIFTGFLLLMLAQLSFAKNMRIMDEGSDGDKGFSIVRTGKPQNLKAFQKLCEQGVRRMIVMAGNGKALEEEYAKSEWGQKHCPGFQVVYDCKQDTQVPLTKSFLDKFDSEVEKAKAGGYGLAFRCNCGCHRTGRLAAYYRMKYQGWDPKSSVKDQRKSAPGLATFLFRGILKRQIHNIQDYIEAQKKDPKDLGCNVSSKDYMAKDCITETDKSCGSDVVSNDPDDREDLETTKVPEAEEDTERVPASQEKATSKQ